MVAEQECVLSRRDIIQVFRVRDEDHVLMMDGIEVALSDAEEYPVGLVLDGLRELVLAEGKERVSLFEEEFFEGKERVFGKVDVTDVLFLEASEADDILLQGSDDLIVAQGCHKKGLECLLVLDVRLHTTTYPRARSPC